MKQTKKLTLSAMVVALGTVFMMLGSVIEAFDLTAVALASVLVAFVYIELGSPYTWLVWLCTTLTTFLFAQARPAMWIYYLVLFGIYPILKGYIEKLARIFWWPIKIVFGNVALIFMLLGMRLVGVPFIDPNESLFGIKGFALYVITWILFNVALIAYDYFLGVMVRYYMDKIRPRFKRILK